MKTKNDTETEKFLASFSLKSSPSGLKEKILDGVLQKQHPNHVMNAFLWKGLVGCLLTLCFVIAVDATISDAQNRRFSSLLDKPQESNGKTQEEWSMLKDIIWEPLDSSENNAKKKFYGAQEKSEKKGDLSEWREFLEKEFD
jgi:hypothetical protein